MVTVLLGAIVSLGIAMFAMSVILHEFCGRWSQVAAALAFDERAFVGGDVRRSAAPRRVRPASVRVPHLPLRRVAA